MAAAEIGLKLRIVGEDAGATATIRKVAQETAAAASRMSRQFTVAGPTAAAATTRKKDEIDRLLEQAGLPKTPGDRSMMRGGPAVAEAVRKQLRTINRTEAEQFARDESAAAIRFSRLAAAAETKGMRAGERWEKGMTRGMIQSSLGARGAPLGIAPAIESASEEMGKKAGAKAGKHWIHEMRRNIARDALVVGVGARILKNWAGQAEEAVTQFRLGKIEAAEMVEQFVRATPILGDIISAGRSIREIIMGESSITQRILQDAQLINETIHNQREAWAGARKAAEDLGKTARSIRNETALVGLKGPEREAEIRRQADVDRKAGIESKADSEKSKTQGEFFAERLKLRKALAKDEEALEIVRAGYADGQAAGFATSPEKIRLEASILHRRTLIAQNEKLERQSIAEIESARVKAMRDAENLTLKQDRQSLFDAYAPMLDRAREAVTKAPEFARQFMGKWSDAVRQTRAERRLHEFADALTDAMGVPTDAFGPDKPPGPRERGLGLPELRESRFLTGVNAGGEHDLQNKAAKATTDTAKNTEKTNEKLDELNEKLDELIATLRDEPGVFI